MTRITQSTSAFFERSIGQLSSLRAAIGKMQGQIATGERIERSSQDPLAASQLRQLARSQSFAAIDSKNASQASDDLEAGSTALSNTSDLLIRARELAVQAGSDTLSPVQRTAIASELDEISNALFNGANSLSISGEPLFGGIGSGPAYSRDAAGVVSYTGSVQGASIQIGEGITIERGVTGPEAFSFTSSGASSDVFAHVANLAAALRGGAANPSQAARDSIPGFDAAIDSVGRAQAVIGARLNWIDNVQQMHVANAEARAAKQQEVGGTELTDTIARLQQTLTVLEASQASFARVSSLSLFDRI